MQIKYRDLTNALSCSLLQLKTERNYVTPVIWISVLLFLIFMLPTVTSATPKLDFRPFLTQDKHRIFEVRDVAEATDGTIWIATWGNGVHRIQGTEWQHFTNTNSPVSDWVRSLSGDQYNRMWCASGDGLFLFEGDMVKRISPGEHTGLGDLEIRLVESLDGGRVAALASGGEIFLFTPTAPGSLEGTWSLIATLEVFQGSRPVSILDAPDGEIWVGTGNKGIYRFDGTDWHFVWGEGKGWYLSKTEDANGTTFWAAERGGRNIFRLLDADWARITTTNKPILSFLPFPDGTIYVGSHSGLDVYLGNSGTAIELPDEVGSPIVESLIYDQRGTFWIGTRQGLVRGATKTWQGDTRTVDNVLLDRLVRGTAAGESLWALDKQGRLCRLEGNTWRAVVQLESRDHFDKSLWRFPGDDFLWAYQSGKLRRYSTLEGTLEGEWPIPGGGALLNLSRTSENEVLLLHDVGAFALRNDTWVPFPEIEDYEHKNVMDIAELSPGHYLAAVEEGAELWTPKGVEPLLLPKNDDVVAVHISPDGAMWLGSFGMGLMRVNEDFSVDNSYSETIYSQLVAHVYEDSQGVLWVAFRRGGIASFQDGHWNTYLYVHGLPNLDTGSIQEDPQGTLWISSIGGGVFQFQPDTDAPDTRIETGESTVASHGIASFTFSGWDAWNHTPGSLLTYSWRILSHPKNEVVIPWSSFSPEKVALTTALSPGSYQIEVRTADENRNVDPTPAHRSFYVQLPFWRRPAFIAPLIVVGTIALVALAIAYSAMQRRRRAEKKLRENEERLTLALHGADLGLWDWDFSTEEATYNERWAEMLGYEVHEIDPNVHAWKTMLHPDDALRVEELLTAHLAGRSDFYEAEYRLCHKSGKWIWVLDRGGVISRDVTRKPLRACGTHLDITQRKEVEQEIARMRHYLQNVIDSMPSTLIGINTEGIVTHWNQEAERVTTVPAAEALGRLYHDAYPLLSQLAEKIRMTLQEQSPFVTERLVGEGEEGEAAYFDVVVYPLSTDGVTSAVIRVDEVTARVAIEEMMVQTEKMLSVGGLAAGMAHEINNPLGGILQACQNIERRTSPDLRKNKEVAEELGLDMNLLQEYMRERGILEFIQGIRSDGARAANIVADMLAFSRQSESRLAPTHVIDMVETVLRLATNDYDLKKHYDFRRVAVTQEHDDELLEIRCDKTKIEQVLLNLVKNATQAMAMAEDQPPPAITIHSWQEENSAHIEVIDNGPGMDEKTRKRVFDPFFTTKGVGLGTGLGLSVSYFIITQQHKGTMTVESIPGQGTRFIICIPLKSQEQ